MTHYKGLGEVGGALEGKEGKEAGQEWKEPEALESGFGEAGEAQGVRDYIKYEVSNGAGGAQGAAEGQDYLGDPENAEPKLNIRRLAEEGAEKIEF